MTDIKILKTKKAKNIERKRNDRVIEFLCFLFFERKVKKRSIKERKSKKKADLL